MYLIWPPFNILEKSADSIQVETNNGRSFALLVVVCVMFGFSVLAGTITTFASLLVFALQRKWTVSRALETVTASSLIFGYTLSTQCYPFHQVIGLSKTESNEPEGGGIIVALYLRLSHRPQVIIANSLRHKDVDDLAALLLPYLPSRVESPQTEQS